MIAGNNKKIDYLISGALFLLLVISIYALFGDKYIYESSFLYELSLYKQQLSFIYILIGGMFYSIAFLKISERLKRHGEIISTCSLLAQSNEDEKKIIRVFKKNPESYQILDTKSQATQNLWRLGIIEKKENDKKSRFFLEKDSATAIKLIKDF